MIDKSIKYMGTVNQKTSIWNQIWKVTCIKCLVEEEEEIWNSKGVMQTLSAPEILRQITRQPSNIWQEKAPQLSVSGMQESL